MKKSECKIRAAITGVPPCDDNVSGERGVVGGGYPPVEVVPVSGGGAAEGGGISCLTHVRQFLREVGGGIPDAMLEGNYDQLVGYVRGRLH